MKIRFHGTLIVSLLIGLSGCAAGGGGGGPAPRPAPSGGGGFGPPPPVGETLEQGQQPRGDQFTSAADDQLRQAEDAEEDGDEARARTHYQAAADAASSSITSDPTNPLPWRLGGIAAIGLGQYEVADSMLGRAEELRPVYQLELGPIRRNAWADLYNQGAPLLNSGQYDEATVLFEGAHTLYQERPEVMETLGQLYFQAGRYDEAVDMLREARGVIQETFAQQDSATQAAWMTSEERLPLFLTQALVAGSRYEEAEVELRTLVESDPSNVGYKLNLASVLVQLDKDADAAAVYAEVVTGDNLLPTDYYQVGVGLYNLQDYEGASNAFQSVLDVWPNDRDAADLLTTTLNQRFDGDDATEADLQRVLAAGEAWLALDPNGQNAYSITARALNRLGQIERATELIATFEALPVTAQRLSLRKDASGATVNGMIYKKSAPGGQNVTVEVTFFGVDGAVVGTESATVTVPDNETSPQPFSVSIQATAELAGYSYTIR